MNHSERLSRVADQYIRLKRILVPLRQFRVDLHTERGGIEAQRKLLQRIPEQFVIRQLKDLDAAILELSIIDKSALELIEHYTSEQGLSLLAHPDSEALWRVRAGLLIWADENRKFRARRFRGRFMEATKPQKGPIQGCAGRYIEALTMMVDQINATLANSKCGLSHLWRHMVIGDDGDCIWLYHHSPSEKYQSIYFRISIRPHHGSETLQLRMESYIPFGSLGDPASYKMGESRNFRHKGWQTHVLETCSQSLTDTINLNSSFATSKGETIGKNLSFNENSAVANSKAEGFTESLAEGSSLADSTNFSLSSSTQLNRDLGSSTTSRSLGEGGVLTESMQYSKASNEQYSTSMTRGTGSQWGYQANTNSAVTLTECVGISAASGKSVQYEVWNYGLDMGEPNEVHLKKWKDAHPQAAEVYDGVVGMFEGCCEFIRGRLESLDNLVNEAECRKLSPEEMSTKILVEESSNRKL